jgi:hypothetical protein
MHQRHWGLLRAILAVVMLGGLAASCGEVSPTPSPPPEPTQVPTSTTFTSTLPQPSPTMGEFLSVPPAPPPAQSTPDPDRTPVAIINAEIGPNEEVVTIQNISSSDQDISGWILFNLAGAQTFRFPDALVLQPGDSVQVYSAISQDQVPDGAFFWTEEKVWQEFPADILLLNSVTRLVYWYVAYE